MKPLYVLLAGMMIARNIRLIRAGEASRWFILAFWVCFAVVALTRRTPAGMALCGVLLLGWLLAYFWKWLFVLGLFGKRFFAWRVFPFLRRLLVWLICSLRVRPLLIAYADHPHLSRLIETQLLPQVGRRAIVIKNWSLQERDQFSFLDRLAFMSVADPGRLPIMVRFRPFSAPRRYELSKALWLYRNGRPDELERLIASALGSAI